jgi:hypothetical protein
MAFAVNDRVKETSTTIGTSTLTLDGAVPGFETFSSAIGNTNITYYAIQSQSVPTEFEVGIGTVGAGTLSRDTIISSSNSDAAVNFSAGTKDVFVTLPASKAVLENDSGVASATTFSGSGAQLTNLNASNVASGTLPDARFPATLPAISGANLTSLNASNLSSGTVDNARLDAELAAIGGLTSAANKGIEFTGSGTAAVFDLTTAGKALLDDADATAQRTTLGLGSIAQLNTVTLTTDTTGDYVASLTAGNLIDLQNNSGEGATPTIDVDLSELTTSTSDADGDFFCVVDSVNAQKKLTKANINISGFNNDSGFIDGSALNASNLSSGTVPDARFPATFTMQSVDAPANLTNLTNLDASDLASGTVPIARIDLNLLTTSTADGDGDFFVVVDSVGAEKKLTKANINISGFNNNSGFTTNTGTVTSVGVTAGVGLSGGGTVTTSGTVTLTVDLSELTDMTAAMVGTDEFIVLDAGADRRKAANEIGLSIFNNDSGFTTNTGTVTSVGVTAGSGLSGGGTVTTSGTITLNVGAGTGIDVGADTIAVDVSDFMTNGVNNRVVTATGTDAMNAEVNLTFDGTTLDVSGVLIADKGYVPEATLTDAATISWNMSTQSVAKVTLAGNRTVAAPTNGSSGQFASLLVIQDGTGSRTLTWNAVYEFAADTAPTLSTTGGKADLFVFRYNGTKWLEVGRNLLLTVS